MTHDPESEVLGEVETVLVDGSERKVLAARNTHRGWLVRLEGVVTRNDAEALRGKQVAVDRDALELADDDVLLDDLIGCKVVRKGGAPWGEIVAIDAGPQQDRLVIHDGDVERLVPLVDALVIGVDVAARVVTVAVGDDWPEARIG